jgi:hypothetical protein
LVRYFKGDAELRLDFVLAVVLAGQGGKPAAAEMAVPSPPRKKNGYV